MYFFQIQKFTDPPKEIESTTFEITMTNSISTTMAITEFTSPHMPEKYLGCHAKVLGYAKANDIGDGICHDHLNHIFCDFDKGDCCLPTVLTSECKICQCFDEIPRKFATVKIELLNRKNLVCFTVEIESCDNWTIGDLYCDDGNNHEECHFDGGDC